MMTESLAAVGSFYAGYENVLAEALSRHQPIKERSIRTQCFVSTVVLQASSWQPLHIPWLDSNAHC